LRASSAFHRLVAFGLLCLAAFAATHAHAEVVVDGDRDQMRVRVDNDTIANVLQALGQNNNLQYRSRSPLNKVIDGSFSGSFRQVVLRVLVGFDFVVHYNSQGIEIFVYGESAATAVAPPQEEAYSPRSRASLRMAAHAVLHANPPPRRAPFAASQHDASPAAGIAPTP
jgi:predicted membrane metal-binding protein